jgi:hypothetical protein
MKIQVEYKVIGFRGDPLTQVIEHDIPDFEEKTVTIDLRSDGRDVPHDFTFTVNEQVMEYLDDLDKRYLMDEHEWMTILDYDIYKEVTQEDELAIMKILIDAYTLDESLRLSMYVTYAKMYGTIKDLERLDQLKVVISSLGLALESQSHAYHRMLAIMRGENPNGLQNPLTELE